MATEAQRAASARYDKTNTRQVMLKLNVNTDADLLEWLDRQDNRQGAIKRLIRAQAARDALLAEGGNASVFLRVSGADADVRRAVQALTGEGDVRTHPNRDGHDVRAYVQVDVADLAGGHE